MSSSGGSKDRAKILKSEVKYRGKIINLRVDKIILPNGREAMREVVEYRGSVTIIPVFDDGSILFVKQYRYPVGEELLELPAGKLEEGEEPLETALRELEEETGYTASKMRFLCDFYLAPGYSTEHMHLFIAEGLVRGKYSPDYDEIIEPVILKEEVVREMLEKGTFKDAKTILGVLYYLELR